MTQTFGRHLSGWRRKRRLSQLQLALRADVSARHLGFVELDRSSASRGLILRLAEELDVPLRERNVWLTAAGYAPIFKSAPSDDAAVAFVQAAIAATLEAHKPFPAFAIDRAWNVVASNAAIPELYEGVRADLLEDPINVARLTLHPLGLAPRIVNFDAWAAHIMSRLRREADLTADPRLVALLAEAQALCPDVRREVAGDQPQVVAVPLQIRTRLGILSFFSTVTVFGSPVDIGISELALEMLYPADAQTDRLVRASVVSAGQFESRSA